MSLRSQNEFPFLELPSEPIYRRRNLKEGMPIVLGQIKADQVVHSQVKWQPFTVVSLSKLTAEGGFQASAMQWKLKVWSDAPRSTDCNLSQEGPFFYTTKSSLQVFYKP